MFDDLIGKSSFKHPEDLEDAEVKDHCDGGCTTCTSQVPCQPEVMTDDLPTSYCGSIMEQIRLKYDEGINIPRFFMELEDYKTLPVASDHNKDITGIFRFEKKHNQYFKETAKFKSLLIRRYNKAGILISFHELLEII